MSEIAACSSRAGRQGNCTTPTVRSPSNQPFGFHRRESLASGSMRPVRLWPGRRGDAGFGGSGDQLEPLREDEGRRSWDEPVFDLKRKAEVYYSLVGVHDFDKNLTISVTKGAQLTKLYRPLSDVLIGYGCAQAVHCTILLDFRCLYRKSLICSSARALCAP